MTEKMIKDANQQKIDQTINIYKISNFNNY